MGYEMEQPYQSSNRRLSSEEIQHLLQNLSSDEHQELGSMLKQCTTEMTLTRGLPFAAAVVGSLYFARQKLPQALHFGPKRWPFYVVVGLGAMTTANLFSMNTCTERIQPHINALWQKYQSASGNSSQVTHEELRRRNREGVVNVPSALGERPTPARPLSEPRGVPPPQGYGNYDEQPSYMSGTPVDPMKMPPPPVGRPGKYNTGRTTVGDSTQSEKEPVLGSRSAPVSVPLGGGGTPKMGEWKKTQYGDEGFS